MTLKKKLRLGVAFLFLLTLLVNGLATYSIIQVKNESQSILQDNYETLVYVQNMQKAAEQKNWSNFEKNLLLQEKNITEIGEKQVTQGIRATYELLQKQGFSSNQLDELIDGIFKIADINRAAIIRKNEKAKNTAEDMQALIGIFGTFCLLIGFSFIISFPNYIAEPIQELIAGIKGISEKNYARRVHFKRSDELGILGNAFNTMAEKLDDWEHSNLATILFEKRRVETIIGSLKDPTIGFDETGLVLFANQQALSLLALKEPEIVGLKSRDVARKNDLFGYLLADTDGQPFKIVVEGKESFFTLEKINITDADRKLGMVITLKNITSFKELDLAKTHFIATISHELKTPLASTDLSLKLLQDERIGQLSEKQQIIVENLEKDNQRLIKIVSELLDLSQAESGQLQLNLMPVQAQEIIQRAIESTKIHANEKQVSVTTNLQNNLPNFQADEEKLTWVLINLLTNAIRYSPKDAPILVSTTMQNEALKIAVQDSGTGISTEMKNHIFERYYKNEKTNKKQTGLGLAISKEFVEAMGGIIGVEQNTEKGATFYVVFKV